MKFIHQFIYLERKRKKKEISIFIEKFWKKIKWCSKIIRKVSSFHNIHFIIETSAAASGGSVGKSF